jgi:prolyl oligopeptidase
MCAALQHATTGDPATRPILLRRETDVGHGARSVSRTVGLAVDQLAFLAAHTGLVLP